MRRNLADVSNDNVLNVHEFVLVVHLVRGLLQGLKLPQTLPRKLTPPKTEPVPLQPATQLEKESYLRVFEALDTDGKGYLEGRSRYIRVSRRIQLERCYVSRALLCTVRMLELIDVVMPRIWH